MSLQEYLFTGSSKVSSCGFWQKRVRWSHLLEGGLTGLQEPTLSVLLALPNKSGRCSKCETWEYCSKSLQQYSFQKLAATFVPTIPRSQLLFSGFSCYLQQCSHRFWDLVTLFRKLITFSDSRQVSRYLVDIRMVLMQKEAAERLHCFQNSCADRTV